MRTTGEWRQERAVLGCSQLHFEKDLWGFGGGQQRTTHPGLNLARFVYWTYMVDHQPILVKVEIKIVEVMLHFSEKESPFPGLHILHSFPNTSGVQQKDNRRTYLQHSSFLQSTTILQGYIDQSVVIHHLLFACCFARGQRGYRNKNKLILMILKGRERRRLL